MEGWDGGRGEEGNIDFKEGIRGKGFLGWKSNRKVNQEGTYFL